MYSRHRAHNKTLQGALMKCQPVPDMVALLQLFRKEFNSRPKKIFYPFPLVKALSDHKGSIVDNIDISPSAVFTESRVVYFDSRKDVVIALNREKFEVHQKGRIELRERYPFREADLVIAFDLAMAVYLKCVKSGGFIITSHYYIGWNLIKEDYFLRGLIRQSPKNSQFLPVVEHYRNRFFTTKDFQINFRHLSGLDVFVFQRKQKETPAK